MADHTNDAFGRQYGYGSTYLIMLEMAPLTTFMTVVLYHLMDTKRMPLFLDYLKEHLFGFRISDGYNILEMAGAASHVHMGIMGLFFIMAGVALKAIYLALLPMVKCSPICMAICTGKTPMERVAVCSWVNKGYLL